MATPEAPLRDRVLVVTGASAGIGAALAREAGRRGAKVVVAARRQAELEEVASSIGTNALAVPTDVTVRASVDALFAAALDRFGRVDVWVNNAGRGITRPLEELADGDVTDMIRDNVLSALYGMQAVLPHFRERGDGQIVNVSSLLSRTPFATFRSTYCAAKAALNSLTESLRLDLRKTAPGITVTLILPGPVATDFGANALGGGVDSRALPGAQTAEEVALVVADAIERRLEDVYTRPEYAGRVREYVAALEAGTIGR
jgi:NAD(P)-dependent dehydrogenase (short-subunit alcohol dehydrogenase family)